MSHCFGALKIKMIAHTDIFDTPRARRPSHWIARQNTIFHFQINNFWILYLILADPKKK